MDDLQRPDTERPPVPRRNRRALLVAGAVVLVILLAVGVYLVARPQKDSPAAAVANIASDAMKGDSASVAASVDTTTMADAAVDEVFSGANQPRLLADYLAKHPGVTEDQIKAKVRSTLSQELREHVESGTLPKRIPLGNESLKALAASVLAKQSVRSVKVEGNVAHVVVSVPYKGKVLGVAIRMQRAGTSWKVDKVENLADVLKQAGY